MTELSLNHITKNFGYKEILTDICFEIHTGERTAIVGRNGTGKSTILKLISGEETPDRGEISIRRGASTAMLEQIPKLRDKDCTVRSVLLESFSNIMLLEGKLRAIEAEMSSEDADWEKLTEVYDELQRQYTALNGYDVETRLQQIISGFHLENLLEQTYNSLSGGQKTVVNLATCVLRQPDILLLDEPTNHLDMDTLDWFEQFLAKYRGTVLMVSHDRWFLDRVATRTIILEKSSCQSFSGNYSFAIKEQERLLLLEFEQYKNQQKKIEAMKAAIKRFREWGLQADNDKFLKRAKTLELRLEKMEKIERPVLEKPKMPMHFSGSRTGHDVLKIDDFSLGFGENILFDSASMLLEEKDRMCIIGGNGTGKSSLLRAVLGENPHYSGKISFNPQVKVGSIPQEIRFAFDTDTILEAFRRECRSTDGEARSILAKYFFTGASVFKRVSSLSGGEKVLLKLCILLQNEVNLLILDEPTNHIDIETREMLEDALMEFTGTLLFVSHDRFFIEKTANKLAVVENRQLTLFDGTFSHYLEVLGKQ